jgi:hypothetical protein
MKFTAGGATHQETSRSPVMYLRTLFLFFVTRKFFKASFAVCAEEFSLSPVGNLDGQIACHSPR